MPSEGPLAVDDEQALAALQLAWIRALHASGSVDEVFARLRAEPLSPAHRAWVEGFDRRAVEVAMAIAKRWVRTEGEGA